MQTESYKIEKIAEYIDLTRHYSDLIHYLNAQPRTKILFNPLIAPEEIGDMYIENPEDFPRLVKEAFIQEAYHHMKDPIRKMATVEITDSLQIKLHEWSSKFEGKPVAVDCQIIGTNKLETYTKSARVFCSVCGKDKQIENIVKMPSCADKECDGRKQVMQLDTSALVTGDIKMVMIQEPVEESRHGTPAIFDCILKDQYALDTFIGQRVRLIGCFRSYPQKDKSTNQILISGISTLPLDDVKELQPTEEQIKKFHELKKLPNYIAVVSESIAPEILHEGLPKLCVLLSLVGSPEVDRNVGMIHTLLIGNPATGKSRILEYIPLLIRKSALAVGGTASGTGITISMDTLANRQRMPRAGIVPLCSGGVAAIDEANQLADEDYGKLYQSMGSGWINYNKGGFDLTLKAMTTIVAGANPKYYTYNTNHSMLDNINMPEPLLSRFSLKVNMSKKKTSIERQQVLQHIDLVDRIGITEYINIKGLLQPEELSTFITYCKTFNPISTPDADKLAMDFQLQMESIEQDEGTAPIDNRFYLSVKKIAKAIARIHFSNTVTIEFVQNAIEIIKKTLITFDMNVEKGVLQLKPNQTEGWEDSMMAVVHHLQKKNSDGRFLPNELCNACVDLYPEIFKFYGSAEKKFNKIAHKFDIINGRYSINK